MSKNTLRLKKGFCYPNQDLLELEICAKLIMKSKLMKLYTEEKSVVEEFQKKNGGNGYYFRNGDGAFLLDSDYEIIIRKVSNKRKEKESSERVKKYLQNNL
jgi:hypothetical protein